MIRATDVLKTIKKCMRSFKSFIEVEENKPWWKESRHFSWSRSQLEDPQDYNFLHDLTHTFRQKDLRISRDSDGTMKRDHGVPSDTNAKIGLKWGPLVAEVGCKMKGSEVPEIKWCERGENNTLEALTGKKDGGHSGLSAYLHFGQLSAQRCVLEARKVRKLNPQLPKDRYSRDAVVVCGCHQSRGSLAQWIKWRRLLNGEYGLETMLFRGIFFPTQAFQATVSAFAIYGSVGEFAIGETKMKFDSAYSRGIMNTTDSGNEFQYWHYCALEGLF
ncbi:deoxyribodipyrimidine photo-lyase [Tanacetum coccineum]